MKKYQCPTNFVGILGTRAEYKKRIFVLVVDDDKEITSFIGSALQNTKYLPITANEPDTAAKLLDYFEFDLIICDVVMPKLEGLELVDRIAPNTPVIFISGFEQSLSIENRTRHYLKKPFSIESLIEKIEKISA